MIRIIGLFLLKHPNIIIWDGFPLLGHGKFLSSCQILEHAHISTLDIEIILKLGESNFFHLLDI